MEQKPGFFEGPPQTMFAFGLACGIALSAVAGMALRKTGITIAQNTAPTVAQPTAQAPTAPTITKLSKAPSKDDHVLGDLKKAKVVLVEYSDFQCSYCGSYAPSIKQAVTDYGDKIALVYRHFPLSFHPWATPAAEAAECANEQGKFWEYHDELFKRQGEMVAKADALYGEIADGLSLNRKKFDECRASDKMLARIQKDQADGSASGVDGTPATFLNGIMVPGGAMSYATLKAKIDAALK